MESEFRGPLHALGVLAIAIAITVGYILAVKFPTLGITLLCVILSAILLGLVWLVLRNRVSNLETEKECTDDY